MPRKKAPVPIPAHVKPHDRIIRSLKVAPSRAAAKRELERRDRERVPEKTKR